ncbi:hypothetical protein F0562_021743 [Nyssa sinensis]|uniref:Protein kinase domain-containing protein n=1 Tax=Nyssa sinensis TaxID=561372 RepID=A0A5J5BPM8_9ASTE|nr:hypothetical protein F0562_021743 [Nyssa sinensis]
MFYLWFLIWVCINLSQAQQFYDATLCSSDTNYPGTRYTCNSFKNLCQTFMVYRASQRFQTISNISYLFSMDPDELLPLNNLTSPSEILQPGREVLVPINCSCSGQFFQASFSYLVPESTTFTEIACGVFEGLLKSVTLSEENLFQEGNPKVGSILHVPLRCACPDNISSSNGVQYLVTYPFIEGDGTIRLGKKFGIPPHNIWQANHFDIRPTVYPNTTFLIPLKAMPVVYFNIPNSQPPTPGFLPTIPVEQTSKNTKLKNLYIAGSVVGFCLVVVALLACGLYVKALKRLKTDHFQSSAYRSSLTPCSTPRSSQISGPTTRSSTNSCLSPDLLVGIKYSLCSYSIEELRKATKSFTADTKIIGDVYKGLIDKVEVMIKQMRFEDTRQVIDVHSKINHVNIVKLLGVCYGENDFSWSYLVFEFPANGCLRDCLSISSNPLRWQRRIQIAFDIATGLHYLHYCMVPSNTRLSISSRNIFLMPNWRAKLAVFGTTPAVGSSKESDNIESVGGEDIEGNLLRESIGFLGGGASEGGCFEQLRNFMDPSLKEDYPLAEALCLAVLAKACVEDDPMHRPSADDIMKVLARLV